MAVTQKRNSLTKRQREIYEYLKDRIINRGYGPTVREIGDHFEIKSPNGVMCHLKALEKKGLIRRESNMSRAICLADSSQKGIAVPLIGTAVSGGAIHPAVSQDHTIDFESLFSGTDKACIKVQGTSFQSLGIADGDYIIVRRGGHSGNGNLIAALDDRHSVALCRAGSNGQQLVPAISGAYPAPMKQILGTVVGVIRQYDDGGAQVANSHSSDHSHNNVHISIGTTESE